MIPSPHWESSNLRSRQRAVGRPAYIRTTIFVARTRGLTSGEIKSATLEYRVRRDDGNYIPIGVNAFVHRARGKHGVRDSPRVMGFVRDMTERQRVGRAGPS